MTTDVKILGLGIIIIIIGTIFSIAYVNNLTQEYHIRYEQNKPKEKLFTYTKPICTIPFDQLKTLLPELLKNYIEDTHTSFGQIISHNTSTHLMNSFDDALAKLNSIIYWNYSVFSGHVKIVHISYTNITGYYNIQYKISETWYKPIWQSKTISGYLW